jgi:hypothetical protein
MHFDSSGRIGWACRRLARRATNDRHVVAGEAVLVEQFADFHFDQIQQVFVVDQVDLVQEAQRARARRLGEPAERARGLRHRTVGGRTTRIAPSI